MEFAQPEMGVTHQEVVCANEHNDAFHTDPIGALAVLDAPQQVLRCVTWRHHLQMEFDHAAHVCVAEIVQHFKHHTNGTRSRRACLCCRGCMKFMHLRDEAPEVEIQHRRTLGPAKALPSRQGCHAYESEHACTWQTCSAHMQCSSACLRMQTQRRTAGPDLNAVHSAPQRFMPGQPTHDTLLRWVGTT